MNILRVPGPVPESRYVYISRTNRVATDKWYMLMANTAVNLFGRDVVIVSPEYDWGDWDTYGPDLIRNATWFCAHAPDDGVVGRGVYSETEIAINKHREITLLWRDKPHNFSENPFKIVNPEGWQRYAALGDQSKPVKPEYLGDTRFELIDLD